LPTLEQQLSLFSEAEEEKPSAFSVIRDEELALTPSWEKAKPRSRVQTYDPHPEIPMSERRNFRITDDELGAGGQKAKYKANIEAVNTLQAIEQEKRFATPYEQEVLSRYVDGAASLKRSTLAMRHGRMNM